jgi:hypothetical protein
LGRKMRDEHPTLLWLWSTALPIVKHGSLIRGVLHVTRSPPRNVESTVVFHELGTSYYRVSILLSIRSRDVVPRTILLLIRSRDAVLGTISDHSSLQVLDFVIIILVLS